MCRVGVSVGSLDAGDRSVTLRALLFALLLPCIRTSAFLSLRFLIDKIAHIGSQDGIESIGQDPDANGGGGTDLQK